MQIYTRRDIHMLVFFYGGIVINIRPAPIAYRWPVYFYSYLYLYLHVFVFLGFGISDDVFVYLEAVFSLSDDVFVYLE